MRQNGHSMIDGLEQRVLMAAAPRVVDVFADNRGTAWVKVDQPLSASSVNTQSVQIIVKGQARPATVTYAAKKKQIKIATAKDLKKDTSYTLQLKARLLKGADGKKLDGEFKGDNQTSGNGRAGGDFVARTLVNKKVKIARMSTDFGEMDLKLSHKETPITVRNFMAYANGGDWDGIFFHQLGPTDNARFLYGGSFYPEGTDLREVTSRGTITNEPRKGSVFGTITMNRIVDGDPGTTEDQNSAEKTWFFNLQDNRQIDTFDGGYATFGKVLNKGSAAVLRKIASLETVDAGSNLNRLPVKDVDAINDGGGVIDPPRDLVFLRRVSMEMALTAPAPTATARRSATELRSDTTMLTVKVHSGSLASVLGHNDATLA